MVSVSFYFQVHQPERMKHYTVFDIGNHSNYFDEQKNKDIITKVAKKCYLPTNRVMLDLINKYDGKFKISYSITGTAAAQFQRYFPEVIESFQALADTGCVEFLSETYYHSLSYFYSKAEFIRQVEMHKKLMKDLFNAKPTVFRNTELIYNNALAMDIEKMGFKGILAEGADHILGWRSRILSISPLLATT